MELEDIFKDYKQIFSLMQPYRAAVGIIKAKLESIDDELKCENEHSPIHNIQSRIKSPDSILEKLSRKHLDLTLEGMGELNDIAGVRVVCHYINDVHFIAQLLVLHDDITLIKQSNYIQYPKDNGYRSLHLIVAVTVHLKDGEVIVPVEIQIRTIAMDMWASLEHELRYKTDHNVPEQVCQRLILCADLIAHTDEEMQKIYQEMNTSFVLDDE